MAVLTVAYAALGSASLAHVMAGLGRMGHEAREVPSCEVICAGELDGADVLVLPIWAGAHAALRLMRHIRGGDAAVARDIVLVLTGQEDPEEEVFRELRTVDAHYVGVYELADVWEAKLRRLRGR